eukprot:scaffold44890_cov73-Attheya_sp.AAC.1
MMVVTVTGGLLKVFVNGFEAEMDELVAASYWTQGSFVPKARQTDRQGNNSFCTCRIRRQIWHSGHSKDNQCRNSHLGV